MTILGTLSPAVGNRRLQVAAGSFAGPASYSQAAGFTVDTKLPTLQQYRIRADVGKLLAASNTGYALRLTAPAGVITVHVWYFAAGAWTELAGAANLSTLTFRWMAIGQ